MQSISVVPYLPEEAQRPTPHRRRTLQHAPGRRASGDVQRRGAGSTNAADSDETREHETKLRENSLMDELCMFHSGARAALPRAACCHARVAMRATSRQPRARTHPARAKPNAAHSLGKHCLLLLLLLAASLVAPAASDAPRDDFGDGLASDGGANTIPTDAAPKAAAYHTVFSAECTPYFDWQTVALRASFERCGVPGGLTRLLACEKAKMGAYEASGRLELAHTFVHGACVGRSALALMATLEGRLWSRRLGSASRARHRVWAQLGRIGFALQPNGTAAGPSPKP